MYVKLWMLHCIQHRSVFWVLRGLWCQLSYCIGWRSLSSSSALRADLTLLDGGQRQESSWSNNPCNCGEVYTGRILETTWIHEHMGYLQVMVMLLGEEKKHAPCQETVEVLVLYIPCYSHNPKTKTIDIATHLRVPGTAIISTLHRLTHFILTKPQRDRNFYYLPFYKGRDWHREAEQHAWGHRAAKCQR